MKTFSALPWWVPWFWSCCKVYCSVTFLGTVFYLLVLNGCLCQLKLQNQVGYFLADFQDTVSDGCKVLKHMKWWMWNVNSHYFFIRNVFLPIESLPCKTVNNNENITMCTIKHWSPVALAGYNGEQAVRQGNAFRIVSRKQEIMMIIYLSLLLSFMDAGHWENIH